MDRRLLVPLPILAEYYWPCVDPRVPISQGPYAARTGGLVSDVAFRPALTTVRQAWEDVLGGAARPSDGFFLINEMRVARRRAGCPTTLRKAYAMAVGMAARWIDRVDDPAAGAAALANTATPQIFAVLVVLNATLMLVWHYLAGGPRSVGPASRAGGSNGCGDRIVFLGENRLHALDTGHGGVVGDLHFLARSIHMDDGDTVYRSKGGGDGAFAVLARDVRNAQCDACRELQVLL
jgi:hypothetical protein